MKVPSPIVLATANRAKAQELAEVLGSAGLTCWGEPVELRTRPEGVAEVPETAPDFLGNARLKAEALVAATGMASLADDSGLEVDHLDGALGVRSARFAGEEATDAENLAKLLEALAGLPDGHPGPRARFRCAVVLVSASGQSLAARGTVEGRIAAVPAGDGGFGYDPVFVPDEGDGRTFAEMTPAEKHAMSHRGRALKALAEQLASS